jgi:SpoVK/Ycf46/Vps4 family AAA+-type ATPase
MDFNSARSDLEATLGGSGQIVMPGDAQSPILTAPVRGALHQWLFEMNAEDELRDVGLKPRSRCLLSGPPGCGKTTLAHHIAARLGLPMLVVQSHEIISKWKGETGQNVGKLFREARRQHNGVALFFDEFDALGTKRENMSGSGADNERAATTIALLQEFDRFDGLLFAATNVTGAIDPALWRRFQMQIEIGMPGPDERFAIVRMYMEPFDVPDDTISIIAGALANASPALIREGCEAIKRSIVLGPKMNLPTDLPAILDRFASGAAAAEGMPIPRLWADRRGALNDAKHAAWPPERRAR